MRVRCSLFVRVTLAFFFVGVLKSVQSDPAIDTKSFPHRPPTPRATLYMMLSLVASYKAPQVSLRMPVFLGSREILALACAARGLSLCVDTEIAFRRMVHASHAHPHPHPHSHSHTHPHRHMRT